MNALHENGNLPKSFSEFEIVCTSQFFLVMVALQVTVINSPKLTGSSCGYHECAHQISYHLAQQTSRYAALEWSVEWMDKYTDRQTGTPCVRPASGIIMIPTGVLGYLPYKWDDWSQKWLCLLPIHWNIVDVTAVTATSTCWSKILFLQGQCNRHIHTQQTHTLSQTIKIKRTNCMIYSLGWLLSSSHTIVIRLYSFSSYYYSSQFCAQYSVIQFLRYRHQMKSKMFIWRKWKCFILQNWPC